MGVSGNRKGEEADGTEKHMPYFGGVKDFNTPAKKYQDST